MDKIKLALLEKGGADYMGPVEYDAHGDSIPFDENANESIKDKIVELMAQPRRGVLHLIRNGSAGDVWLSLSEAGINSNKSSWIPPYNCTITDVIFTNKKSGRSNAPLTYEIRARYISRGASGDVKNNSSTAWYISNSPDPNLVYNEQYGRNWHYDASNDNDEFLMSNRYGFRLDKQGATGDDVYVEVHYKEKIV